MQVRGAPWGRRLTVDPARHLAQAAARQLHGAHAYSSACDQRDGKRPLRRPMRSGAGAVPHDPSVPRACNLCATAVKAKLRGHAAELARFKEQWQQDHEVRRRGPASTPASLRTHAARRPA